MNLLFEDVRTSWKNIYANNLTSYDFIKAQYLAGSPGIIGVDSDGNIEKKDDYDGLELSSVGTGESILKNGTIPNLSIKSLVAGSGITINPGANELEIVNSASGGITEVSRQTVAIDFDGMVTVTSNITFILYSNDTVEFYADGWGPVGANVTNDFIKSAIGAIPADYRPSSDYTTLCTIKNPVSGWDVNKYQINTDGRVYYSTLADGIYGDLGGWAALDVSGKTN